MKVQQMIDANATGQQLNALTVMAKFKSDSSDNAKMSFLTAHAKVDQVDTNNSKLETHQNTFQDGYFMIQDDHKKLNCTWGDVNFQNIVASLTSPELNNGMVNFYTGLLDDDRYNSGYDCHNVDALVRSFAWLKPNS